MAIRKIERVKVSDQVFEQMRQMILNGTWKPGQQLAGEMELVEQFGVSRVSIRAALQRLVGMGVLYVRQGNGTFVSDRIDNMFDGQMLQAMMSRPQLKDALEFRLILEVGATGLAAQYATEQDILALRECERLLASCPDDVEEFAQYDILYHKTLTAASKNGLIISVMDMIRETNRQVMIESIRIRGVENGRYNHAPITSAVANHNRPLAEELMREHIRVVIERFEQNA